MQERIRVFYLKDIYDLHLKVIKDNKQNLEIDSASLMSIMELNYILLNVNKRISKSQL